jgi:hypothetical protein
MIGLATDKDALDFSVKLPAGCTLLIHIMRSLGADAILVSKTDVRHFLIATDTGKSI